jgi:nitrilase
MTSGAEVTENLASAGELLRQARDQGVEMAFLPENFSFMGKREADRLAVAEDPGGGPVQDWLAQQSSALGVWLVGGTLPMRLPGAELPAASCLVYDQAGMLRGRYDKIHLFDVRVSEAQGERQYRESSSISPGSGIEVLETPAGRLGLSVCYDVRFPELYRALLESGAEIFSVPAAFTVPTGRAHWELLLRARAVENLAFVAAPAQWGRHPGARETWGHSMIVGPWGEVLARRSTGPGVAVAQLDRVAQGRLRREFPCLEHRKLTIKV